MRERRSFKFLDWPGPIAFAHRGFSANSPENTMTAFQAAVDLGYRYLETDVHATSDGVLVAFHNRRLDHVTDRTGEIAKLPWSYVREAKVAGRESVPLLEDVLTRWPQARVNIDPKSDGAVDPLVRTILDLQAVDRVCIGSFSSRRLARVRAALGENICTSIAPAEAVAFFAAAYRLPIRPPIRPCAQLPARRGPLRVCTKRLVDFAHRHQMQVHAWTVNDREEMVRLLDIGIDGIITDQLSVLRDLLTERGQWYE
jgi:glycerophosphoryl diester phosphodiesterase